MREPENLPTTNADSTYEQRRRETRAKASALLSWSTAGLLYLNLGSQTVEALPEPTPEKVMDASIDRYRSLFLNVLPIESCPAPIVNPASIDSLIAGSNQPKEAFGDDSAYNNDPRFSHMELVDTNVLFEKWFKEIENAATNEEVAEQLKKFMHAEFDLPLAVPHPDDLTSIELDTFKGQAIQFTGTMHLIPKNLMRSLDLNGIVIKSGLTGDNGATRHNGEYDSMHNVVTFDPHALDSSRLILHETLGHAVHDTVCSDTFRRDSSFSSQNPEQFRYSDSEWRTVEIDQETHASQYATVNVVEDYAETISKFLTMETPLSSNAPSTPLDHKILTSLDRLDMLAPGSAEYFMHNMTVFHDIEQSYHSRINPPEPVAD